MQTKVVKSFFVLALGTDAFYDEVGGIDHKIFGQFHSGDVDVVETVGLSAGLAIEVYVLVVVGIVAMAVAQFVFERAASVLDGVHQIVLEQEVERAEYGAAVCRDHSVLHLFQADGVFALFQHTVYQNAHGCGLYATFQQVFSYFFITVHCASGGG